MQLNPVCPCPQPEQDIDLIIRSLPENERDEDDDDDEMDWILMGLRREIQTQGSLKVMR